RSCPDSRDYRTRPAIAGGERLLPVFPLTFWPWFPPHSAAGRRLLPIGLISRRGCAELPAEINHWPACRSSGSRNSRREPMLRTVAAFDRIGEENAFAVLARATALAAQGRDIVNLGIGLEAVRLYFELLVAEGGITLYVFNF